jgi:hypothetical protein
VKILLSIKFQAHDMMNKIHNHFINLPRVKFHAFQIEVFMRAIDLVQLGRYLSSFSIANKSIIPELKIASSFKQFSLVNLPFCHPVIQLK